MATAYRFTHRTLTEYLVAEHLTTVGAITRHQVMHEHLFDPDWAPVWPLVGPLFTNRADLSGYVEKLLTVQQDPVHHWLSTAAMVLTALHPDSRADTQPQIDQAATRLLRLLETPARHQAAHFLGAVLPLVSAGIQEQVRTALTEHRDLSVRRTAARSVASSPAPQNIDRVRPFLFGPAADRFAGGERAPSRAVRRRFGVHNSSLTPRRPGAEVPWPGPKVRKCCAGIHDVAAAVECRFGLVRSRHRVPSPR
jgi:hypothetical protein